MPDKRSASRGSDRPQKRRRSNSIDSIESWDESSNHALKVYLVQEKLDEKHISEINYLIESHRPKDGDGLQLQPCSDPNEADVIITKVRMIKRLERHLDWHIAKQKAIVTPDWIWESVKHDSPAPCAPFAAITQLRKETAEICPHQTQQLKQKSHQSQDIASFLLFPRKTSHSRDTMEVTKSTGEKVKNNWRSRYACARAHPLICANQDLAIALNVLGHSRTLEGLNVNALAYERAVAIIKSYPCVITRETLQRDVAQLPGIGDKVHAKVEEYLKYGEIGETEAILRSERYQSLSLFTTVHGIGASTARHLYEIGLRTIEDLERYYDVPQALDATELDSRAGPSFTPNGQLIPQKNLKKHGEIPPITIKVALALRKDLNEPISSSEVEEMQQVVMAELEEIQGACKSIIVGGYRRGKSESNDVDIIITHSDITKGAGIIKGLCSKLVKRLHEHGIITHATHLSGFHRPKDLHPKHRDSLEKALTIFRLPVLHPSSDSGFQSQSQWQSESSMGHRRLHRRLDLIFAAPEAYWTAVIGWSGSRMFERDLRLWAKVEKGMKFDSSGLTRRHDSKLFVPVSEEDAFRILGLDWIDPTMRNANV